MFYMIHYEFLLIFIEISWHIEMWNTGNYAFVINVAISIEGFYN